MIRYQKVDSVFSSEELPSYTPTDEGRAMAHIPKWNTLLDPDYIKDGYVRNRVIKDSFFPALNSAVKSTVNGKCFNPSDTNKMVITSLSEMNNDAWSVIVVAKPYEKSVQQINGVISEAGTSKDGDVVPKIGFDPELKRFAIYNGTDIRESGARLSYFSDSIKNKLGLYIATFSVREGLSIFHNGKLVAVNKKDNRKFSSSYGSGEWSFLRGSRGEFGYIGIIDIDLSWVEHSIYLKSVQDFLLKKYNI